MFNPSNYTCNISSQHSLPIIPLIQQHSLSFLNPYFIKYSPCEIICLLPIQDAKDDKDTHGVYRKAQGQDGRIALICHGLYNVIQHAQQHPEEDTLMTLPNEISNETMEFAVAIMQLRIAHKCALMPPPVTTPIVPADDDQVLPEGSGEFAAVDKYSNLTEGKLAKRITSLLTYGLYVFDPSLVAQRKLMPAVDLLTSHQEKALNSFLQGHNAFFQIKVFSRFHYVLLCNL